MLGPSFLALIAVLSGAPLADPASPREAPPIDGRFDVGGRSIRLSCRGSAAPTVVIDAGMGSAPVEDRGWQDIAAEIAPIARVCLYDRAGLGGSDPAPPGSRTSADSAADLRAALVKAGVKGPYLLVGHSIGGLHALVFAERYPADTAGLVLVSSTHPDQTERWLAALPPAAAGEDKALSDARTLLEDRLRNPSANPDSLDLAASSAQARQLKSLGAKPVIVATHSPRFRMVPGLPEPLAIRLEAATQEMQKEFLTLSTDAKQNIAATAGHGLPHEAPQFVVANILEGVAAVRRK